MRLNDILHSRRQASSPPPGYVPSPHPSGITSFPSDTNPTTYDNDKAGPFPHAYDTKKSTSPSPPSKRLPAHLTSRPLLFLTLLSPPVLGIIIILVTLILITTQSRDQVAGAKREIMAGCSAAVKAAGALQAVPDVLEAASKRAMISMIEKCVRGVGEGLVLALLIIKVVLEFLIDTFRSTYLCCLELAVFGSLAVVIAAVEEISNAVSATIGGIRTLIQTEVRSANTVIQTAFKGINAVSSVVGKTFDVPEFNIPALSKLEDVKVGTKLEDTLKSLNASLPTLNEMRSTLNSFIETPFEAMSLKINQTTSNFTFTPSNATDTGPSVNSLATTSDDLCSDLDLTFVDDAGRALGRIMRWGVGLLCAAGFIAILILLYLEHRRYAALEERIRYFQETHTNSNGTTSTTYSDDDLMELVQFSQHGIVGVWASRAVGGWRRLKKPSRRRSKWFIALITHPLAIAPLLIGVLGLICGAIQIRAIHAVQEKASSLTTASLEETAARMSHKLNAQLADRSERYVAGMNADIAKVQTLLDDELFGEWVNTTTVVLNSTLVQFYDILTVAVNDTLGTTVLAAPVNTFLFCILGSKVEKMEQALTWIHDNAHFTLPTVPIDIFQIDDSSMNALVLPVASAAVGGSTNDDDDGVLGKLIASYIKGVQRGMILHGIFFALWVLVFLGGLVTIIWTSRQEEKDRQIAAGIYHARPLPVWLTSLSSRSNPDRRTSTSSSYYPHHPSHSFSHQPPVTIEKISSLSEAFSPPRVPFGTPLPSPLPPLPVHQQSESTEHETYFQMDGGNASSSQFPWLLRSQGGVLDPEEHQQQGEIGGGVVPAVRSGWKEKLVSRFAKGQRQPPNDSHDHDYGHRLDSFDSLPNAIDDSTPLRPSNSTSPALPSPLVAPIHDQYHTLPTPTPTTNAYPNLNPIYSRFASTPYQPSPQPTQLRHNLPPPPPTRLHQYQAQQASAMAAARNPFEDAGERRVSAPVRDPFRTPFDDPHEV